MLTQGTCEYEKNKNNKGKRQWRKFLLLPETICECFCSPPLGEEEKNFMYDFPWEQPYWFSAHAPHQLFLHFDYMELVQEKTPHFLAEVVMIPALEDTEHSVFSHSSR